MSTLTDRLCTLQHDHLHGQTSTCYVGGGCRCADCMQGRAEYAFWRRHNPGRVSRIVDGAGTRRRLRALAALGWTFTMLADRLGVTNRAVRELAYAATVRDYSAETVRALYDDLSMTVPTSENNYAAGAILRQRRHAARNGWLPPLALDDDTIDLPETTTERTAA